MKSTKRLKCIAYLNKMQLKISKDLVNFYKIFSKVREYEDAAAAKEALELNIEKVMRRLRKKRIT